VPAAAAAYGGPHGEDALVAADGETTAVDPAPTADAAALQALAAWVERVPRSRASLAGSDGSATCHRAPVAVAHSAAAATNRPVQAQ
jgi:hypothetical protein